MMQIIDGEEFEDWTLLQSDPYDIISGRLLGFLFNIINLMHFMYMLYHTTNCVCTSMHVLA
jgi:hypothetical protein